MFNVKLNAQMVRAWSLLSLLFLGMVILRLIRPDESVVMKMVLVGVCILNPGILVSLVRVCRGPNRDWREQSEGAEPLSTWGYFWRAYVAFFSQFPILILVNLLVPVNLHVDRFSAVEVVLWEIPFVLASALGTWLLFSRDRRGQARTLMVSLRGY